MAKSRGIRRVIERSLPVTEQDLESVYIIRGQPLTSLIDLIGVSEPRVVNISTRDNPLGIYIPPRPMSEVPPLANIAGPLGINVTVSFYDVSGIPVYFVSEPPIDDLAKKFYVALRERAAEAGASTASDIIKSAEELVRDAGVDPSLAFTDESIKSAIYYVFRDLTGYGPLEIPMEDSYVEEVSWYAYDKMVQVVDKVIDKYYPNSEFIYTNIFIEPTLPDIQKKFYMTQVVRSVTSKGRVGLTVAKPLAEARIPDPTGLGFHRLAAHLDVVSRSPALTIRKFPHKKMSITELIKYGTLTSLEAAYLLLQLVARGFILIVGGMGSGKTTLLQALISALPTSYKVVTIEDTPELSTPAPNWHPLYVRRAPKESELENIDFSRLVIHSLRHRGTVVTLGEVRGKEMADLIQAAASGHAAICLPADTPVLARPAGGTPRAVPIKTLVERVERGEEWQVYSFDYRSREFKWSRVTATIRVPARMWVEAETEKGRRIRMTPDHRIPVLTESGDIVVKEAEDLEIGDRIIVAGRLPRQGQISTIECCGVVIPLKSGMGKLAVEVLRSGRSVSLSPELEGLLNTLPLPIKYTKTNGRIKTRSKYVHQLVDSILGTIRSNPLSIPAWFLEEMARHAGEMILLPDKETAEALHYALRTAGYDTVTDGSTLRIIGRIDTGYVVERIVSLRRYVSEEESYDIEVEGTHSFVTGDSIVSNNCTFHASDPSTVLARITSPPINAAPESLLLITSIVNIAKTKTYARGKPETVRRVVRIYEINEVHGRNVKSSLVFRWNPLRDLHSPQMTVEGLKELWRKSRTIKVMGYDTYVDEAPRILVAIYALAYYLDYLVRTGVYDIKTVAYSMTAFYLQLDKVVDYWWRTYFRDKLLPLMRETQVHEVVAT